MCFSANRLLNCQPRVLRQKPICLSFGKKSRKKPVSRTTPGVRPLSVNVTFCKNLNTIARNFSALIDKTLHTGWTLSHNPHGHTSQKRPKFGTIQSLDLMNRRQGLKNSNEFNE